MLGVLLISWKFKNKLLSLSRYSSVVDFYSELEIKRGQMKV